MRISCQLRREHGGHAGRDRGVGCTPCGSSFAGGGSVPPTLEELIAIVLEAPVSSATQAEIIEELLANYHN